MKLETVQPINFEQLIGRMTAKERADILSAETEDRIEYIRQTAFIVDGGPPSKEMMQDIVSAVHDRFEAHTLTM